MYHVSIGFPKNLRTRWGVLHIEFESELQRKNYVEEYGYELGLLNTDKYQAVQVATDRFGFVTRITYKLPHSSTKDCLVTIHPCVDKSENLNVGVVKNVRIQEKDACYKVRNPEKYQKPGESTAQYQFRIEQSRLALS